MRWLSLGVIIVILFTVSSSSALESNSFSYDPPEGCSRNSSYHPIMLSCLACAPHAVGVGEGQCTCKQGYYATQDTGYYMGDVRDRQGGLGLECSKCAAGLVSTADGRMCLKCQIGLDTVLGICLPCPSGHIQAERDQTGELLTEISCIKCSPGTSPDRTGRRCEPCTLNPLMPEHNVAPDCTCTKRSGLCLPSNLDISDIYIESSTAYTVQYGDKEIDSTFFKERMTVAAYMCGRHLNTTSCNLLANLCTLTLHKKEHPACSTLRRIADRNNDQTYRRVPGLFLQSGQSVSTLESEAILTSHSLEGRGAGEQGKHRLNITVARYSAEGRFLGLGLAEGNMFHLCKVSRMEADSAWNFGTRYKKVCKMPGLRLWDEETVFYDLYYPYSTGGEGRDSLYSVFALVLNNHRNLEREESIKSWELTSRFFLVDSIGGLQGSENRSKFVRYLEDIEITVTLLNTRNNPHKPGRIHPPLVKLRYRELSLEEAEKGEIVKMSFSVNYRMDMKQAEKDVEIAVGVLSALAVLLSAVEAWSWTKRSGRIGVDIRSLVKLVVATAGNLSHVFLAVIFFSSLYWFIFFKQQKYVHTVLPAEDQETFIKQYLISAFSLKLVDVLVLLVAQVTVDVFLVDWERPPPSGNKGEEEEEAPVSVWRTYLVANEWNEIQTLRKSSISLQVILFLIIMKVFGLENLATADPHNRLWPEEGIYMSEHSYVCRFALGVSIWAAISVVQVLFWVGVYSAVVENKLAQFTDICSLSNISVFVMSQSHYGYYVHGKSAHGTADTNMAGLLTQLQREADDLCGHRGLQAGSDHQTFSMSLPITLRSYYDKIVTPASRTGTGRPSGRLTGTLLQSMVNAYTTMNRFLTRFLEHALKDLDYEIREKNFLESVLDIEFHENTGDRAVFYKDQGYSFSSLLLYGHEFTLTVWEILVMSFVDLFAQDFLLAAILTYFVSKLVSTLRYLAGRSNLATKTLIDKRFLI